MANTVVDLDTLDGMFKQTYAEKIEHLIPDGVKLMNEIEFLSKEKSPGDLYHQPVTLGLGTWRHFRRPRRRSLRIKCWRFWRHQRC
jgi:hypothetical protein